VTLREFFVENLAGDLEYNPRRATLYLSLGGIALCSWLFLNQVNKFSAIPLVCGLGSLTLLTKGIFLFRKSSEGLAMTESELAALSDSSNRKSLPSISEQVAQIIQDFGAGSFLLWPLLNMGTSIDQSWDRPPRLQVFVAGAILFFVGWLIRSLTTRRVTHTEG
jgi:hypothetical protein